MRRWRFLLLTTSALLPMGLVSALAGPNGASVVAGAATVSGQGTASVVVNQSSPRAIINWNTFNIGAGEKTAINMPGASSVELDRVTGGLGPSQILGSLTSNGNVFLVNRDGILFGPGATINVGSLLATTHDIANSDFMAGSYNFSISGNPAASIVNQGVITAQTGGFAALVAPGVRNTGTISAKLGTIAIASGNAFTLDFYGDDLITLSLNDSIAANVVDVSTGQPLSALVSNAGKLKADGGRVQLTAVAARQVVDSIINNTGVIEANTVGTHNGMIVLGAATGVSKPAGAPTQTVKVSGTLSAAGKRKGTTGGTIEVTGETVQVSGAKINASGASGGGVVLLGGDWGGGNPNATLVSNPSAYLEPYAVPNASTVSVDAVSVINASATDAGNGGKVILWSNGATTFYGTILAQGGAQSGSGGFVETSGHQLSFDGVVNTGAHNGVNGTLLLDPLNAMIAATAGSEVITTSSIESALLGGDVVVTTVGTTGSEAGDITVASSLSWTNANTLTLNAYRDININDGVTISNTAAGNLMLRADATGTGIGTVNFTGTGGVDFSQSTGAVSIYYNSTDNPAGSVINTTSYATPIDYAPYVLANGSVSNQLIAYMLVNSAYDLQNIQNNLSGNYALGTNIYASSTVNWNGGAGFAPIGNETTYFAGTFDGQGHTIDQLTINYSSNTFGPNDVGLFGVVGGSGTVRHVGLTNIDINATFPSGAVGGLVGLLSGTCSSSCSGVTVSDSYVTGTINGFGGVPGPGYVIGGLVGNANYYSNILHSFSSANVTTGPGTYSFIGGLAGGSDGEIFQSYATGAVTNGGTSFYGTGGLVGSSGGNISQSFATGAVDGGDTNYGIGGFAGTFINVTDSYATGSVTGSSETGIGGFVGFLGFIGGVAQLDQAYSIGAVSGTQLSGGPPGGGPHGFIGSQYCCSGLNHAYWDTQASGQPTDGSYAGVTALLTSQLKSGLPSGFDPAVWGSNPNINNGYPYLLWQTAGNVPSASTTFTSTPNSGTLAQPTLTPSTSPFPNGQLNTNFYKPNSLDTTTSGTTPAVISNLNTPSVVPALSNGNDILNSYIWTGIPGPISPGELIAKVQPFIGAIDALWHSTQPVHDWTYYALQMGYTPSQIGAIAETGFQAAVYISPSGQPILVFQSTNNLQDFTLTDIPNALAAGFGGTPSVTQYSFAAQLAAQVERDYPLQNLALTGFSLGGGLAAYAGATDKIEAITFDPAGISNNADYNSSYVLNFQMNGDVAQTGGVLIGTTIRFNQALTDKLAGAHPDSPGIVGALERHFAGIDAFTNAATISNLVVTSQVAASNGGTLYTIGQSP